VGHPLLTGAGPAATPRASVAPLARSAEMKSSFPRKRRAVRGNFCCTRPDAFQASTQLHLPVARLVPATHVLTVHSAGRFCSELTAIDISSSAVILGHRWFGGLKNSEMVLARPLFFAAVGPNPTIASCHRRVPSLHFLRTRRARQIWRCHCEERLARRRNLDRSSAQRHEIASLSLAMTVVASDAT
jgi:hypothetical protein